MKNYLWIVLILLLAGGVLSLSYSRSFKEDPKEKLMEAFPPVELFNIGRPQIAQRSYGAVRERRK